MLTERCHPRRCSRPRAPPHPSGRAGWHPPLPHARPATPAPDRGPIVCVCFDVGLNTLLAAITGQRLVTVEAVGAALHAGTNCGSCRPAIAKLLPVQESIHV